MPWSASSGATKNAKTTARPMSAAAMPASVGRLRRRAVTTLSRLGDDVLERRPRQYNEDRVVQREKREVALAVRRDRRPDPADHERDREREEEQRQEELARAPRRGERRHERADRADPDVGEKHAGNGRGVKRLEEEDERGQRHGLRREQKCQRGKRLPEPDRASVARRQHETVEDAVLVLRHPGARETEQ